jgi:hypothetical protein
LGIKQSGSLTCASRARTAAPRAGKWTRPPAQPFSFSPSCGLGTKESPAVSSCEGWSGGEMSCLSYSVTLTHVLLNSCLPTARQLFFLRTGCERPRSQSHSTVMPRRVISSPISPRWQSSTVSHQHARADRLAGADALLDRRKKPCARVTRHPRLVFPLLVLQRRD